MEEQGDAQEPEAGPAPAGSGPARAEEFDLSLDEIINRNKKGQTNARGNRWRQPFKNWNPAYGNRRPRFRSWMSRNMQGANRFRTGGPQKPQYFRKPFWNGVGRPRWRAAAGAKSVSPLNRPAAATQDRPEGTSFPGSSEGAAVKTPQGQPARVQQFRGPGPLGPAQSNRPFRINRRPAFYQRQFRSNFNGGQTKLNAKGKPSRNRRWQVPSGSGAVLTISVSNPQASQTSGPGAKRPFLKGRSAPMKPAPHQPKGVPLRFNFRAMANQTSLTLNERFSGLWKRRRFAAPRNPGRMVTLP